MSKRKSGECDQKNIENPWTILDKDANGLVKELCIRHLREDDDKLAGEDDSQHKSEDRNGEQQEQVTNGKDSEASEKRKKIGFFQGKSYSYQKKRLPIPRRGQPTADVVGFRSITLDGMQDWEDGIDPDIIQMLTQVSPLVSKDESEDRKFCLFIALPYAFKGSQAANFGRNLDQLLEIPGIQEAIGALSYSEGGHLAEMLARFPHLGPNPKFLYRYDSYVYAENDTLVEDYFADLEHWLFSQWIQPPPTNSDIVRQAQLKFAWARQDTAEQMIELLTENFNKANSPYADRHTFVIRLDCPAFSLEPFHIENNKTSEILALEYKDETVLSEDLQIDDFFDEEEEPAVKREKPKDKAGEEEAANGTTNDEEVERIVWKSYKLVRAKDAAEFGRLMAGQLPMLKRKISIIH